MRQLLLLRHAKSSWDDRDLSDHARPLNPRGRQAAGAMRAEMERLGLAPDLVLVSSARRTKQTAEALEPWPDTPLTDTLDSLYLASAATLLQTLNEVPETVRSVLLVGHNPGLHELAMLLIGAHAMSFGNADMRRLAETYPSGALAEFTIPGPWSALNEAGGRLVRFVCPRDLPSVLADESPQ
jgi:phosphohistidine phosphatase